LEASWEGCRARETRAGLLMSLAPCCWPRVSPSRPSLVRPAAVALLLLVELKGKNAFSKVSALTYILTITI